MKLPNAKIEMAASPEESRYALHAVQLDTVGKRLMASDGHILAVIPADVSPEDNSGLIPVQAFTDMRKMVKAAKKDVYITCNGNVKATTGNSTMEWAYVEGKFPNADAILADLKFEGPATFTLNLDLLVRLAAALGAKNERTKNTVISLWIKDAQSSMQVKTSENPDAVGVIMPCHP